LGNCLSLMGHAMSIQTVLLYFATWTLVALTPGPAVMYSMAQSTRHGFRSSLAGIAGIQLGNFVFFVCVALGLGAVLATANHVFAVLRFVGALYLLYLGCKIILGTFRHRSLEAGQPPVPAARHRNIFLQGLLIQLTNPKAILFVSALLPQFIDARRPAVPQLGILVLTTIAVDTVVLSSYAFVASRGIQSFRQSRLSLWLERAFGMALIGFGLRLVRARR
jgi:homoserine/homoserine lactone efflux protein